MTTIWMDGALRPLEEAHVTVLAHTLHYGVGVFEGIRSYPAADGKGAVFRLEDHLHRFEDSATICGLTLPFDREILTQACLEVLAANDMVEAYLRPIAYQDDGTLGGLGASPPVRVVVAAQHWGAYLGEEGLHKGIRARVSPYRRGGGCTFLSRAKVCGQYVSSTLAKREAVAQGVDEALLTDDAGNVCEGSGENLFMIKDGVLTTPPASAPILPGITRATVLHLARGLREELHLSAVREDLIPRDSLLVADEAFLTGTAAEVTPVREIDGRTIGPGHAGPITLALQKAFFEVVRGERKTPAGWRTVFEPAVR